MRKIILAFGSIGFIILLCSSGGIKDLRSNGAPLGSTGAPIEHTCAKSGCHAGADVNSGSAVLSIGYNNGNLSYEPGVTYTVTVSVSQADIQRFGYEVVALSNEDSSNAGTFTVIDNDRTQIFAGINEFTGRNYMTYKYAGTNPYAAGLGQWSFQWTAPAQYIGPITFYTAAVAANNDGTDGGDSVYTKQITLQQGVTGIAAVSSTIQTAVYPNPSHDRLSVQYEIEEAGDTKITLQDILSQTNTLLLSRHDNAGSQASEFDITAYSTGVYLVTVSHNGQHETKKIIVE